jgi:AraC-like DNA-binding protein
LDHPARRFDDRWPDDVALRFVGAGYIEDDRPGMPRPLALPWVFLIHPHVGRVEMWSGSRRVVAEPGTVLVAPPRKPVAFVHTAAGSQTPVARFAHVSATLWGDIDVFDLVDLPDRLTGDVARDAIAHIDRAIDVDPSANALARRARWKHVGFGLVDMLVSCGAVRPEARSVLEHASRLAPLLARLRERPDEDLDIAALARIAGVSRATLHRWFLDAFGVAPMTYVRHRRLDEGARLLVRTDETVATIATRIGYREADRFARAFAARFGATPSSYRQRGFVPTVSAGGAE